MQLFQKRNLELHSIFLYSFRAYENIAGNAARETFVFKGDNIGKLLVLQKFLINPLKVGIIAENNG